MYASAQVPKSISPTCNEQCVGRTRILNFCTRIRRIRKRTKVKFIQWLFISFDFRLLTSTHSFERTCATIQETVAQILSLNFSTINTLHYIWYHCAGSLRWDFKRSFHVCVCAICVIHFSWWYTAASHYSTIRHNMSYASTLSISNQIWIQFMVHKPQK